MSVPTSFTLQKATPYSLVYLVTGGAAGVGTRDGTTLISDFGSVNGPLRALITNLNAASALNTLNLDGTRSGRVRIRWVTGVSASQTLPNLYDVHWNTTAISASLPTATQLYLEIRLTNSTDF
jgi:hypothetical protein